MNPDEQLDTFRRQWKNELKDKNITREGDGNGPDNSKDCCQNVKKSCHTFEWESYKNQTNNSGPVHKQGTSSLYYPFQIAGNFLDSNKQKSLEEVITKDNKVNESEKNFSYTALKTKNNKRLKVSKLEDIFVERTSSEVPNERLLDKLISDIVSRC